MKKRKRRLPAAVLAAALTAAALSPMAVPVQGAAEAADEIPEEYMPIYDIADLQGINNDLSGNYILMNDIDLSETAPGGSWDSGHGWTPIGAESDHAFSGQLEGNGHFIKNMHIYGETAPSSDQGLFSYVSGSISHLGLLDCDISITHGAAQIGGIAGTLTYGGCINNCFVSGKITSSYSRRGYAYIGGIAGLTFAPAKINDCYNCADITVTENALPTDSEESGDFYAGGIAGISNLSSIWDRVISRCYNVGTIYGTNSQNAGGIIGKGTGDPNLELENAFYLKSSVSEGESGTALTEAQMRTSKAFTGFDFTNTWYIDEASDYAYPQLRGCPQTRVAECTLSQKPDRLEYAIGDDLDLTGGVLSITYENGVKSLLALEADMVSGYDQNKPGTQTISVSYGNKTASFEITVKEILADALELNHDSYNLKRGDRFKLSVTFSPANATDNMLTWNTSNELVAAVSANGTVKGLNAGTAVITAETKNGIQASCRITVEVPAKNLKLNVTSLTLKKGTKKTLKASMTPLDATDTITWLSSNSKIAVVSKKGVVTAKRQGTAVIMAKTTSGISKKVKVIVN